MDENDEALIATAALAIGLGLAQPAFAQDKTGYADVNGLHVYYGIHGESEPLVLLHGAYMSIRTLGELVPLFAALVREGGGAG